MKNFNMKEFFDHKAVGFYVGAVGCVLALVTLFVYIGMNSMYFTGWVVTGLVVGMLLFVAASLFRISLLNVVSYFAYMFALYQFLVLEIDYRMDILVDTGIGGLDAIFIVAVIMFLAAIITSIVSTCMKQEKEAQ